MPDVGDGTRKQVLYCLVCHPEATLRHLRYSWTKWPFGEIWDGGREVSSYVLRLKTDDADADEFMCIFSVNIPQIGIRGDTHLKLLP